MIDYADLLTSTNEQSEEKSTPHQLSVFHHYCASQVHKVLVCVQHMGSILTERKWLLIPEWH